MKFSKNEIEEMSKLGQRGTYGYILNKLADEDESIVAITADLIGASNLKAFKENHNNRLINVGIAEQNMQGIAAGFAKNGFKPYSSTFAPFAAMRSCEQLKLYMGYMNLNMKVIGMASGFSMGPLGNTHYCIEDLSITRAIPNIIVESPADCLSLAKCLENSTKTEKPMYIRLTGEKKNPIVYDEDFDYVIGKGIIVKSGDDIVIVATGSMVYECIKAAEILKEKAISAEVIDIHTIKPIDEELIIKESINKKLIVTVEEHNIIGGLSSSIAEIVAKHSGMPAICSIGVQDKYPKAGSYRYVLKQLGLERDSIVSKILEELKK